MSVRLFDDDGLDGTVCSMMFRVLAVLAVAALSVLAPLPPAVASEADAVVGVESTAATNQPEKEGTTQPDNGGAGNPQGATSVISSQLKEVNSIPRTKIGTGGPTAGPGSKNALVGSGLPSDIVSVWPSPGSELLFPIRESRVSFVQKVDTRTFRGRIFETASGKVAVGIDGTPALFTRATITATESRDVIGTYPPLAPGEYQLEFSVTSLEGEELTGVVPFTQMEPIVAPGGGNHRHGEVRLPFEEQLTTVARGLLILSFALLFRRRGAGPLLPALLAVAGVVYSAAFLVAASDTILTTGELLGRVDGWASFGVLAAAVTAAMARRQAERAAATVVAAVAALSTTYTPFLDLSVAVLALLTLTMLSAGGYAAASAGWLKISSIGWLLLGTATAVSPVLMVLLTSGSLNPPRGMGSDIRERILAAAVILVATVIGFAARKLLPNGRLTRVLLGLTAVIVTLCAALATTAPPLL